jgi:hypothetical protein
MKDEIVSFKVAKLAKEKGFDEKCEYRYINSVFGHFKEHNGELGVFDCTDDDGNLIGFYKRRNSKGQPHLVIAPTQSLLQRWLREEKKLHISIDSLCDNDKDLSNFYWMYDIKNNSTFFLEKSGINFKTYEEALEQALEEALKLIKDKNEHRS